MIDSWWLLVAVPAFFIGRIWQGIVINVRVVSVLRAVRVLVSMGNKERALRVIDKAIGQSK